MSELERQRDALRRREILDDWWALERRSRRYLVIATLVTPLAIAAAWIASSDALFALFAGVVACVFVLGTCFWKTVCPTCAQPFHRFNQWQRQPFSLVCEHCGSGPPTVVIAGQSSARRRPAYDLHQDSELLDAAGIPSEQVDGRLLIDRSQGARAWAAFQNAGRRVNRLSPLERIGYRLKEYPELAIPGTVLEASTLETALVGLPDFVTHIELIEQWPSTSKD